MSDGQIAQIRVRNYQSLRKADFRLGNITAIVGPTDSGKSAFFRAVKAVVENQDGTDFITVGEKRTVVDIDGVAWIQSEKENEYRIGDKVWQRVGRGVPDEVRAELGMGVQEFGKDVKVLLNFAGQLDRAFLVEGNPADSAKIVGAISNVHKIYNGLREAEKDAKSLKRGINEMTESLESLNATIATDRSSFNRLDEMEKALDRIFSNAKKIDSVLMAVTEAVGSISKIDSEIARETEFTRKYGSIDANAELTKIDTFMRVFDANATLVGVDADILATKRRILALQAIDFEEGINTVAGLDAAINANKRLVEIRDESRKESEFVDKCEKALYLLKKELDGIDACETCGAAKKDWRMNV